MNLFEKHLRKDKGGEEDPIGEGDVVVGSPAAEGEVPHRSVKRLEEGTDVSFFVGGSDRGPVEEHAVPGERVEQGEQVPQGSRDGTADGVPPELLSGEVTVADVELDFRDGRTVLEDMEGQPRLSTGLPQLDAVLGGGLEAGSITEVYGGFSSGKTQLCFQLVANCLSSGGRVLFLDTESTFRPSRVLDIMGSSSPEVLERLICVQARSSSEQLRFAELAERELDLSQFSLVIVDSLTALFRAEYTDGISVRQQLINRHLRDLLNLAVRYRFPVLVTNQITTRVGSAGSRDVAVGGNIVAHGTTHRLEFRVNADGTRTATVRDSPSLPEGSCTFRITRGGLV